MHNPETKNEFLKLRAQGLSFDRISSRLHVSKPTLLAWNRQQLSRCRSPRALELKAIEEILPEQELLRCTTNLRAVEQELASRGLREISTDQLQRYATVFRERIQELCAVKKQVKDQSNSVKSQPT